MLATMAVNTSGGTRVRSSWTKIEPTWCRVSASRSPPALRRTQRPGQQAQPKADDHGDQDLDAESADEAAS
jgi:hypothetical protein